MNTDSDVLEAWLWSIPPLVMKLGGDTTLPNKLIDTLFYGLVPR
jgi:hypothetical protein